MTTDTNELPKLPEPTELFLPNSIVRVYYADDMECILRSYALLAIQKERERCAALAESFRVDSPDNWNQVGQTGAATDIAAAIRKG